MKTVVKRWTTVSGLEAIILLVNDSHHCGYVVSPESLIGMDYDEDIIQDIYVHGGVTFSDYLEDSDDDWVFGFDCAHYSDKTRYNPFGVWRDEAFCVRECEILANQLKELGEIK